MILGSFFLFFRLQQNWPWISFFKSNRIICNGSTSFLPFYVWQKAKSNSPTLSPLVPHWSFLAEICVEPSDKYFIRSHQTVSHFQPLFSSFYSASPCRQLAQFAGAIQPRSLLFFQLMWFYLSSTLEPSWLLTTLSFSVLTTVVIWKDDLRRRIVPPAAAWDFLPAFE